MLVRAEREGLSHLEFFRVLIGEQADRRRERGVAHRIREDRFRDGTTLADFDWQFNAAAIDRVRIEALATAEFIDRQENLVVVGQSGVGKSHIIRPRRATGRERRDSEFPAFPKTFPSVPAPIL